MGIQELISAIERKESIEKVTKIIRGILDKGGQELQVREEQVVDTPLHAAVRVGNYEIFELLMQLGADVDIRDGQVISR